MKIEDTISGFNECFLQPIIKEHFNSFLKDEKDIRPIRGSNHRPRDLESRALSTVLAGLRYWLLVHPLFVSLIDFCVLEVLPLWVHNESKIAR